MGKWRIFSQLSLLCANLSTDFFQISTFFLEKRREKIRLSLSLLQPFSALVLQRGESEEMHFFLPREDFSAKQTVFLVKWKKRGERNQGGSKCWWSAHTQPCPFLNIFFIGDLLIFLLVLQQFLEKFLSQPSFDPGHSNTKIHTEQVFFSSSCFLVFGLLDAAVVTFLYKQFCYFFLCETWIHLSQLSSEDHRAINYHFFLSFFS